MAIYNPEGDMVFVEPKDLTEMEIDNTIKTPLTDFERSNMPQDVLEAYDCIERLLVGKSGKLFKKNEAISSAVLYQLQYLYDRGVTDERNSHAC